MRSRTSRGVPEWSGGKDLYMGSPVLVTEKVSGAIGNVPIDKGNCMRDCLNPRHRGSSDEIIVEYVEANMGIQIPLLVIDRRTSRSCLHASRTRRVYTLKVR